MTVNISTVPGGWMKAIEESQSILANITNETSSGFPIDPYNKHALELTRLVVQRILVPVISSFGFFGNIISISVLTRKCMISSTNCYLTTLSVFDLLYIVFGFTLSLKHYKVVKELDVYMYVYPYTRVLTDVCSNVSVCLTVTFSLERLIAVCFPMKGRTICTPERARTITVLITVGAMICTAPEFLEWKAVRVSENNVTRVVIMTSEIADTVSYQVGYNYFLIFMFTVLPLILLSTFNGILIKTVLAATKIRRKMTYNSVSKVSGKRNNEQTRITVMLIGVVVVFLLCQFPNAAVLLYSCYLELREINLPREDVNNIIIAANVVNLLVLINASVNFVLYSVLSTKFRRVFLQMCCGLIGRKQEAFSHTSMTYSNSTYAKSQTSPYRCRSQRVGSVSANGLSRQVSEKCRYVKCDSQEKVNDIALLKLKTGNNTSSENSSISHRDTPTESIRMSSKDELTSTETD